MLSSKVHRWFLASMLPVYPPALFAFVLRKGVFAAAAVLYVGAWIFVWSILFLRAKVRSSVLDAQDRGEERAPSWARVSRRMRERSLLVFSTIGIPAGVLAVLWGLLGLVTYGR